MLTIFARSYFSYFTLFVRRVSQIVGIVIGSTLSLIPICADVGINEANFQTLRIELPILDGNVYNAERYSGVDIGSEKFSWVGKIVGERAGIVSFGRVSDSISLKISFSDSSYFYRGPYR